MVSTLVSFLGIVPFFIGLVKASLLPQWHKATRTVKSPAPVIIEFLGLVLVMLSRFPNSYTDFLTPFYTETTSTTALANPIQRPCHLGCSLSHTPSRQAIRTGCSTSEVCSGFPTGTASKSTRTACRAVCPSSKHGYRRFRYHSGTPANSFDGEPRTTSSFFGPTFSSDSASNSTAFAPWRCTPSARTSTTPKRKNCPSTSDNMSFPTCAAAHGTSQNTLGCSV
jgi:hypothetical protein